MDQGGWGVPNLLFYHYAFSLRHPREHPSGLKSPLCNPLPPMHYIITKLSLEAQSHPIIAHLQWVWKKMAFILNFVANLHTAASIWPNPKLCIGKLPFLWKSWVDNRILALKTYMLGIHLNLLLILIHNSTYLRISSGSTYNSDTCCCTHSGLFQHVLPL